LSCNQSLFFPFPPQICEVGGLANHPQEEFSQIWLHVREDNNNKKGLAIMLTYILAIGYKLLSKYGDFPKNISS
jgi:hypothetical protein